MAVVLRLTRRGTTNRAYYHIVAADKRFARDGRFLDDLGYYDPLGKTSLAVDEAKARKWLSVGATPTATVAKLLKRAGIDKRAP